MKKENIAIITARKGSERIKNKNLKLFFKNQLFIIQLEL